jgi:putative peptide zinc metalloprotease protein
MVVKDEPEGVPDSTHAGDASHHAQSSGTPAPAHHASTYAIEPEVIFLHRQEAGERFVVAKHMAMATYYRLGLEEYQVARLLTGNRSVTDVVVELRTQEIEWSIADVAEFIGCLVANGLARLPDEQSDDLMTSLAMSVSALDTGPAKKVVPRRAASESAVFDVSSPALQPAPNEPGPAELLSRGDKDHRRTTVTHAMEQGQGIDATVDSSIVPEVAAVVSESSNVTDAFDDLLLRTAPVAAADPAVAGNAQVTPASPDTWYRRLIATLSLLVCQRIHLGDGDRIAKFANEKWGFLFSVAGCWNWLLLVFSGLLIVLLDHREFVGELAAVFDPDLWLILFAMWAVAKLCHEIGHAVAARHHGTHVGKFGFLFFFLAPLPFVDVTDAWKLESKWKRIQIGLGGVYLELALAAIAAWVWWLSPSEFVAHLAAQFFLVAGPGTLLINANPLLRLDGYYVLSDLAEIPNLRMHGRKQLASLVNRLLMGTTPEPSLLRGWRRPFATCHAFCSVVFQCFWMTGLIVAISHWMKGLGIVIAAAAISLWVILPLLIWFRKIWFYESNDRWQWSTQRLRLLSLVSLLPLAVHFLATDASPFTRRIPVVVRNQDPQIARATADARVKKIYVNPGQRVLPGMLLLELENPELNMQRSDLADELEIAEVKAIQWRRKGELARAAAESGNAESLRRRIAELDQQIEGLNTVAERAGYVLNPDLLEFEGRYVKQGEELCQVMDPRQKELLASVGEVDLIAYRKAAITGFPVSVRLRGGATFFVTPTSLQPRARRKVLHPTLAATSGGPLPVEVAADDKATVQSLQPQMQGLIQMDQQSSRQSRDGQIGMMTISDNRSILDRIIASLYR